MSSEDQPSASLFGRQELPIPASSFLRKLGTRGCLPPEGQHRRPDHCRISLQDARRQPLFLDVDIAGFLSLTCSPRARRRPCTAPPCSALVLCDTKPEFRSQRKNPLRQPRPP